MSLQLGWWVYSRGADSPRPGEDDNMPRNMGMSLLLSSLQDFLNLLEELENVILIYINVYF